MKGETISKPMKVKKMMWRNETRYRALIGAIVFLGALCVFLVCVAERQAGLVHPPGWSTDSSADQHSIHSHFCEELQKCNRSISPPPLLVVSLDGFAARYLNLKAETRNLNSLLPCSAHAQYMKPSFPSKTFPNHYTIATGLHPETHGVIDNNFVNHQHGAFNINEGKFYSGEPIWNTVTKNNREARMYFWVGSESDIGGISIAERKAYNKSVSFMQRIDEVVTWLSAPSPPALSMLYYEKPDAAGHAYGPDSEEVRRELVEVDAYIGYLLEKLSQAGMLGCINVAFLSDHGMRSVSALIDLSKAAPKLSTKVDWHTSISHNLFGLSKVASTSELACQRGEKFRIYDNDSMPYRLHLKGSPSISFPYIAANPGVLFFKNTSMVKKFTDRGSHGWNNEDELMRTIFIGVGPSFKENYTAPPFYNYELYNLFADVMELRDRAPNNGTAGLLHGMLKRPPSVEREASPVQLQVCDVVIGNMTACGGNCDSPNLRDSWFYGGAWLKAPSARGSDFCMMDTNVGRITWDNENERPVLLEALAGESDLNGVESGCIFGYDDFGECENAKLTPLLPLKHALSEIAATRIAVSGGILKRLIPAAWKRMTQAKGMQRYWAAPVYDGSSLKYVFLGVLRCDGDEASECEGGSAAHAIAFLLPNIDRDINCLSNDDLLRDFLIRPADFEQLSGFSLLPREMSRENRLRISSAMAEELW